MPKFQPRPMRHLFSNHGHLWIEVAYRVVLVLLWWWLEKFEAFERKIQPEEMWLYKNPPTDSYVPTQVLWPLVTFVPAAAIFLGFLTHRSCHDVVQSSLAVSLILGLNGVITTIVKLMVGRPRPDFFYRCFPDGVANADVDQHLICTGNPKVIIEGRKSFPSGHSSFSFASLGFVSLYAAAKLGVFNGQGRGCVLRLTAFLAPLLVALAVALSRTCDYHHHWQDVLCGSLLGLGLCYMCYRQYYPPLDAADADVPSAPSPASGPSAGVQLPYKLV